MWERISKSIIELFLECPRKAFYSRCKDIPKKTDLFRLCGIAVHNFVRRLENRDRIKDDRRFFYRDAKSARGAWFYEWNQRYREVRDNGTLIFLGSEEKLEEKQKELSVAGVICVQNYWSGNFNLPHPLEVEKTYSLPLGQGLLLYGIMDQVRRVSLEYVARHRPTLIKDGHLVEGYDNVVIIDLKTDQFDYDVKRFNDNPSLMEQIRRQYDLHENLQATIYTYLYHMITGKKPIGFLWYHLRSGKYFFTYREENHYQTMFTAIHFFVQNVMAELFPKHSGKRCATCDYLLPCNEDRHFLVVQPEQADGLIFIPQEIPTSVQKESWRQLRLGPYRVRRLAPKLELPAMTIPAEIRIANLPWDNSEEENLVITIADSDRDY